MALFRFSWVTVWLWNGLGGSGFQSGRFFGVQGFSLHLSTLREKGAVLVPLSVPEKRFQRFRFWFGAWALLELFS